MTEISRFWDGLTVGDATSSPYDAKSEFAEVLQSLSYSSVSEMPNGGGVFTKNRNELNAVASLTTVSVQSGTAIVDGTWYKNDNTLAISIAVPAASTRIDRIVLRKDFAAQTIRLTVLQGIEGGSEPGITNTPGVTWDLPLWKVSITTGGVITLTDEREILSGVNGLVGFSNAKVANYVVLSPGQLFTFTIPLGGGPPIALPALVHPKVIALNIAVNLTSFGHTGVVNLADSPSVALNYYQMRLSLPAVGSDINAGVLNINPGNPATFDYVPILVGGNVDLNMYIFGYWEYIA